jgi:hypothetical protein
MQDMFFLSLAVSWNTDFPFVRYIFPRSASVPSSMRLKANHFLPKSFSEAPI